MRFRRYDRGYAQTLLCLPGWGLDGDLFDALKVPYNLLIADRVTGKEDLEYIHQSCKAEPHEMDLLGVSMGGLLGMAYDHVYPGRFRKQHVIGFKTHYESQTIQAIKTWLKKNKRAYLRQFYKQCFNKKESYQWFVNHHQERCIEGGDRETLMTGLDYLDQWEGTFCLTKESLFIHQGKNDRIAPVSELGTVPNLRVYNDSGHLCVLKEKTLLEELS